MIFASNSSGLHLPPGSLVIIVPLVIALAGAITFLHRLLMKSKDDQLQDMTSQRNSYKEMLEEALTNLEKAATRHLASKGLPDFPVVPPVVPEHNSPTTQIQQDAATLQTARARLVAATAHLDLPARKAAELEKEGEKP